jgi:DNA-binding NarL/FixJ family response regulator
MTKPLKVGLVDDKAVNRSTIAEKIRQFPDIEFCFSAVNGNDCLQQLKGLPQDKIPALIFMDLEMPEMDGIQTIQMARSIYPGIFFIVLTVFDDEDKIFEAIKAGANGYLLKDESPLELYHAILNAVEGGGAPMSAAIARKALSLLSRAEIPATAKPGENGFISSSLTEREKEILHHTINGYDAKRIASVLNISVLTIRKHIANIYQKLHVNSKAQVINLAYKNNWSKDI